FRSHRPPLLEHANFKNLLLLLAMTRPSQTQRPSIITVGTVLMTPMPVPLWPSCGPPRQRMYRLRFGSLPLAEYQSWPGVQAPGSLGEAPPTMAESFFPLRRCAISKSTRLPVSLWFSLARSTRKSMLPLRHMACGIRRTDHRLSFVLLVAILLPMPAGYAACSMACRPTACLGWKVCFAIGG